MRDIDTGQTMAVRSQMVWCVLAAKDAAWPMCMNQGDAQALIEGHMNDEHNGYLCLILWILLSNLVNTGSITSIPQTVASWMRVFSVQITFAHHVLPLA